MIFFIEPNFEKKTFAEDINLSIKSKYIMFSLLHHKFSNGYKLYDVAEKLGMSRSLLRKGLNELEGNEYLFKIEIKTNAEVNPPRLYLVSVNKGKLTSGDMASLIPKEEEFSKHGINRVAFYVRKKVFRIWFDFRSRARSRDKLYNNILFFFSHSFNNNLRLLSHSFKKKGKTAARISESPSLNFAKVRKSAKVKVVWDCWIEFASKKNSPLPNHRVGTKKEKQIVSAVRNALGNYSELEICEAIEVFYIFLNEKCPPTYKKLPGFKKVPLNEFIRFSPYYLERISSNKISSKIINHQSWLRLCMGGLDIVEDKFIAKRKADGIDPKIIKQFEKSWVKFSGNTCTQRDKNNFTTAAELLLQYVKQNKRHLNHKEEDRFWIYDFVRGIVFGCLNKMREEKIGRKKIHSGFLTQDFFFNDELTEYIKFIGAWKR